MVFTPIIFSISQTISLLICHNNHTNNQLSDIIILLCKFPSYHKLLLSSSSCSSATTPFTIQITFLAWCTALAQTDTSHVTNVHPTSYILVIIFNHPFSFLQSSCQSSGKVRSGFLLAWVVVSYTFSTFLFINSEKWKNHLINVIVRIHYFRVFVCEIIMTWCVRRFSLLPFAIPII